VSASRVWKGDFKMAILKPLLNGSASKSSFAGFFYAQVNLLQHK